MGKWGEARTCAWCDGPLSDDVREVYCKKACRQSAYRARKRGAHLSPSADVMGASLRVAYADPPYPGTARKFYGGEENYAGEVDHEQLLSRLVSGGFDGWALSTSARALPHVLGLLGLCPPGVLAAVRVCAWAKPHCVAPSTYGIHNAWEPVLVKPARLRRPGVRDWLAALPARGGGTLPGRKPVAFCCWLFELLGMQPGDVLVDLYPGTGIVGRTWRELSSAAVMDRAGRRRDASFGDLDRRLAAAVAFERDCDRTTAVDAGRSVSTLQQRRVAPAPRDASRDPGATLRGLQGRQFAALRCRERERDQRDPAEHA